MKASNNNRVIIKSLVQVVIRGIREATEGLSK